MFWCCFFFVVVSFGRFSCLVFISFLCPMFIFEDLILQGNAYKDPVLLEVFHIFIVVLRCSSIIEKKKFSCGI